MSDETTAEATDSGPYGWGWDADGKPWADRMPDRFKKEQPSSAGPADTKTPEGTKK